MSKRTESPRVTLLAGGVGGARMATGLCAALAPGALSIVANIGDDERFYGLHVSPDLDTILYTLAGAVDVSQGWGVSGDTVRVLETLLKLGAPAWMKLGDVDFALHIYRSWRLANGDRLTDIMSDVALRMGLKCRLLPATDGVVPTEVDTEEGVLRFQEWFVERRSAPKVRRLYFKGASTTEPTREVRDAIGEADIVIIAPSNPLLSIEPILALRGLRQRLAERRTPCVAISPLINGRAVKGPLDRMLADMGLPGGAVGIAECYAGLIDGIVIDQSDASEEAALRNRGIKVLTAETYIKEPERSKSLAELVLDWAGHLNAGALAGGEQ
ncbi:2-phospho-L-lactate transferase [Paraburkholderia oxyphila]|uniref:2-phospho-L-lactate transferase n=1 Tax=Paraburkholderia oxyphila TaxID=614212 RepID=UPI0005BAFF9E|nr:2-phospho-L-lactate transferase [Paraburkholderia oxyphila]